MAVEVAAVLVAFVIVVGLSVAAAADLAQACLGESGAAPGFTND